MSNFDYDLAIATGVDVPLDNIQLVLHQPTIKEISLIGEKNFFIGIQTVCLHKNMHVKDESDLDNITNFQIFMMIIMDKETIDKQRCVRQLFSITFPDYTFTYTPRAFCFKKEQEMIMIDEDNFESFQNTFEKVFIQNSSSQDQQAFNPANAEAKKIADKLMRGRKRVAEQKSSGENSSVFSKYISILSVGLNISKLDLIEYTMPMLYDELERYILYKNWDLDIKVKLAGGTPNTHPEDWMKTI